jgi:Peptidase family M23
LKKSLLSILFTLVLFTLAAGAVSAEQSTLYIEGKVPLYNEASLITESGAFIENQTVEVLEERTDGWYRIKTWLGEKWVAPKGAKIYLDKYVYLYDDKSLLTESDGAAVANQTLTVLDQTADGWWLIKTWLGDKWIAPDGIKVWLPNNGVNLHNDTSFLSKTGASINAQTITVIDQRTDGWWLIKTWLGDKWIAPNGVTFTISQTYPLYNDASFSSPAGASVANQKLTALDQRAGGWWKIKTWLGDKWINTNTTTQNWTEPLVQNYVITDTYGTRNEKHKGIDLAASGSNVKIVAAANGVVTKSYKSSSYGEVVFIKHNINGKTYETVYAHMRDNSRKVSVGQTVSQGQELGLMGSTGDSTGQHLHFELHEGLWNDLKSNAVDPQEYIIFTPNS